MPAATGRGIPLGLFLVGGCACLGLVLVIDGALRESLNRYRFIAYGLGGLMTLPLAIMLLAGSKGMRFLRYVGYALVPSMALLMVTEMIVRLAGFARQEIILIEDQRLGHRMKPGTGEADVWGFRNQVVPARTDVVFLGDSQVFGFGVDRSESIPSQFAQLSGLSTLNLGLVGYGPVQYRELAPRALGLDPKALVIGFYLGNDFIDAYMYAHLPRGIDLRLPGRSYPNHRVIDLSAKEAPNWAMAIVDALRDWSCLFDLAMTGIKNSMLYSRTLAGIYQDEPGAPAHEGGGISTLFTPQYRFLTFDPDSELVHDGMRITDLCLEQIAALAATAKVPVMLLLIHTKEYYYQKYYQRTTEALPDLVELHAAEQSATQRLMAVAGRSKMLLVDPTVEIVESLIEDHALWHGSSDGHPNENGYGVFAQAVMQAWQGLSQRQGR